MFKGNKTLKILLNILVSSFSNLIPIEENYFEYEQTSSQNSNDGQLLKILFYSLIESFLIFQQHSSEHLLTLKFDAQNTSSNYAYLIYTLDEGNSFNYLRAKQLHWHMEITLFLIVSLSFVCCVRIRRCPTNDLACIPIQFFVFFPQQFQPHLKRSYID